MLHLHDAKKISTVVCACRCSVVRHFTPTSSHTTTAHLRHSNRRDSHAEPGFSTAHFHFARSDTKKVNVVCGNLLYGSLSGRQRLTNVDPNRSQLQTTTDPQCFSQVHLLFLDGTPRKLTPNVTLTRHRGLDVIKERVFGPWVRRTKHQVDLWVMCPRGTWSWTTRRIATLHCVVALRNAHETPSASGQLRSTPLSTRRMSLERPT